jgi:hypothetical protein
VADTTNGKRTTDATATAADEAHASEAAPAGFCPVAFCPICTAVSVVHRASPEVVDHLLSAAREFLLAARAVVDARAADYEDDDADRDLQKIEIG